MQLLTKPGEGLLQVKSSELDTSKAEASELEKKFRRLFQAATSEKGKLLHLNC